MKNLAIILTVCLLLGAFVSCTTADADGLREASVAEAVQEFSAEKIAAEEAAPVRAAEVSVADAVQELSNVSTASVSLTLDDVTSIFSKVREMYNGSDTVKLTDGEIIYTAKVDTVDLAYAQSLNSSNSEAVCDAYEKYVADVVVIALDMIEALVGEGAVVDDLSYTRNPGKPDALVALDLSGAEDARELHSLISDNYNENRSVEGQDDILYVYGSNVFSYKLAEMKETALFPSQDERKILYALRNPSSGNVVQ